MLEFRSSDIDEKTISDDIVVTKYKAAGEVVNKTLKALIALCVEGASVKELCIKGDSLILEETGKIFKKEKDLKKGIAFPTCLSVNNCVCHYSPTKNEADYVLKTEDLVKIDMGAHIDGFIAVVAHTIVVGSTKDSPATSRRADVILAAYWAGQAALRLLKPSNGNYAVTEAVQKIADVYKCKPIEGMLSHQLKQFKIDGEKTIIQNPSDAQKKEHEKCEFELNEVYAMDVLISTGDGVGKEQDTKVSIYKKTEENYQLKLKSSRNFFHEVKSKHGVMPFNLRHFEEETKARMGVVECVAHKLIEPFQVLYEKPSEYVAQFKYTVLLTSNGPITVTGIPLENNLNLFKSEYKIDTPELKALINSDTVSKNAKKNKNKKKSTGKENAPEKTEANAPAATAEPTEVKA